jgi:hypothetical protein
MILRVFSSFGCSRGHLCQGLNNKSFISYELLLKLLFEWVEHVVKVGSGLGDVVLGGSNLVFEILDPSVMLVQLPIEVLGVDVNLELVVSEKVLESLDEISNWGSNSHLEI